MHNRSNESFYYYLFLLPCVIYIFVWRIFPVFYTLTLSFLKFNLLEGGGGFVGLKNYLNVLESPQFHNSFRITLLFTLSAIIIQIILGILLALLIENVRQGRHILRSVLLIPLFLPPVAVGTIWLIMFNDIVGPINYFLKSINLTAPSWLESPFYAFLAILIADTWQWTPFTFILIFASLLNVNQELYEAARVDGASKIKIIQHITLPLIRSTIFTTAILRSMDAFRIFDKVYLMTAGGPGRKTEVLSMLVAKSAFEWFEIDYAAALVFLLLIFLGIVYFFLIKYLLKTRSR